MDLAHTLIRSVARAFYTSEYVLIIDSIILHSALRDDDLAYVMGSQTKHTRKLCAKLTEDGILHKESRSELRQGANRATNRDYYFINLHSAIDNIKWRFAVMKRKLGEAYGQTEEERKDYVCPQCNSEFTQIEVLDTADMEGNFTCKRCGETLNMIRNDEKEPAGHEVQSRLNTQLVPFESLLRRIDEAEIPENDFDYALQHRREVKRDELDQRVKSEPVPSRYAPAATHGIKIEEAKLEVDVHDDGKTRELQEAARNAERAKQLASQNALPAWHTQSTVTGDVTNLGRKEQQQRDEILRGGAMMNGDDQKDEKDSIGGVEQSDTMKAYLAALQEQENASGTPGEESDSEEEGSEDDDDFEDVGLDGPSTKKIKLDIPVVNGGTLTNGASKADPAVGSQPGPSNAVMAESNTSSADATPKQEEADSDEDELDFQDV